MEKPILFNTEMVKSILEGRKTVTRRVCKQLGNYDFPNALDAEPYKGNYKAFDKVNHKWVTMVNQWLYRIQIKVDDYEVNRLKPPYQVGDTLWVKETWNFLNCVECDGNAGNGCVETPVNHKGNIGCFAYKVNSVVDMDSWKSSIHMPKEAARIFLKVTDVRVERLQDITEDEAFEEAVTKELRNTLGYSAAESEETFNLTQCKDTFKLLWDSAVNKKDLDKCGWEANPFVWVIEFERVEK